MRIYISKANESWIVDRFREEWYEQNPQYSTKNIFFADLIWIISPWTIRKSMLKLIKNKKVICTVHHIDEENFMELDKENFEYLDQFVDIYHTISKKSHDSLKKLTNKKIYNIPFWVDPKKWFYIDKKEDLRKKYGFSSNDYLIGSFQRDTEGKDLISPKLIKGPDVFIEIVKNKLTSQKNLKVVLTGKRRQFIINELKKSNIEFKYFEMIDFASLNELYNILDLYVVSSRIEGGPQAILECASARVPIISTDVGIASEILSSKSIYNIKEEDNAVADIETQFRNVQKYYIPKGMEEFLKMFNGLYES
tara:strand:- start:318 stop:1241 length:924 start_codon:yes stop_codon:yes gene_type:complete